jgi:hypothetical protein
VLREGDPDSALPSGARAAAALSGPAAGDAR